MYLYNLYNLYVKSKYLLPCADYCVENTISKHDILIESIKEINITNDIIRYEDKYNPIIISETNNYLIITYIHSWRIVLTKCGDCIYIDENYSKIEYAISVVMHLGMNICLIYKGFIPFHSAAFSYNCKITAFLADSGVGKSTLAFYSMKYGAKFVTDDVLPVTIKENNVFGFPANNFMPKVEKSILIDSSSWIEKGIVGNGDSRIWISIKNNDKLTSMQAIDKLYVLEPSKTVNQSEMEIVKITNNLEVSRILFKNILDIYVFSIEFQKNIFLKLSKVVSKFQVYSIKYYRNYNNIDEILKRLLI